MLRLSLIASVATIPLSNQWNSIAIIVFAGVCVLGQPLAETTGRLKQSKFWVLPVLIYLWLAASFLWDSSGGYSIKDLERYSILLFIPPVMAGVKQIPVKHIWHACFAFVAITAVVCLICLVRSYNEYQVTQDSRVFYYHYLSEQMQLNAIFLSNYCLASIVWVMYYSFVEKTGKSALQIILLSLTAAFLFGMILMLSSKLIIALTMIIVIAFLLVVGYTRGFLLRSLLIAALIIAAGFFAVKNFSYLNYRINVTEIKTYAGEQDDQNGVAIRLFMWKTALGHIAEKPWLGYGIRGAKHTTLDKYAKTGFDIGVRGNYHSHNQYLESALMGGIPGGILFILFLVFAFRHAFAARNFLLLLLLCHFAVQSVFESTFEVQHEQVFYIFFIFLFYYHAPAFRRMRLS